MRDTPWAYDGGLILYSYQRIAPRESTESSEGMINMTATPKTATTAEIAAELQTTPRELRKFLRSQGSGVGKGSRYALPSNKAELGKMRKNFANWAESAAAAKAAKKVITPEEDESDKTDNEVIEDNADEPTDADIEALELEEPTEL